VTPLLLVLAASGLTFRIELPQERVLIGEPVKVVVRLKATTQPLDLVVLPSEQSIQPMLALYVNDGTAERRYFESERGADMLVGQKLAKGQEISSNVVLFRGGYQTDSGGRIEEHLLFGEPGEYRVRAEYTNPGSSASDRGRRGLRSNQVRIRVEAPRGADAEILSFSMENRLVLAATGSARQQARTRELMAAHPASPHLTWARLKAFYYKGAEGAHQGDQAGMLALRQADPASYGRRVALYYLDLAKEVLAFPHWGVFEEDALAQAYLFARSAHATDLMKEIRERLLAKYPRSAVADVVRERPARPPEEEP
jgi:hypothetical protein